MSVNLLLVAAGTFWLCAIVGLGVWWHWQWTRRTGSSPDVGTEAVSGVDFSADQYAANVKLPQQLARNFGLSHDREMPSADGTEVQQASWASLRFPYPNLQWMAPCKGDRLPDANDFVAVDCHELFGDGVSFYSEAVGEQKRVVISLGTRATMIFMLALVTTRSAQPDAMPARFLVECQFIRRIRAESASWARVLKSCEFVQESTAS